MANEALAVRKALDAIKTQLTTAVPLAIDAVIADTGLALSDPTGYDVTDELRWETQLPRVKIYVEGEWESEHYMTPQENVVIPLTIATIMQVSDDPTLNYRHALEMLRAVENALSNTWRSVTGAYWYRSTSGVVGRDPTPNTSRFRRVAALRGTFKIRTRRVE